MIKRTPACFLSVKQGRYFLWFDGSGLSATLNVRSLSLPDQTRVVMRRHHDRLLVSLHRTLVRRLPRT
jgi:hypothetical protein